VGQSLSLVRRLAKGRLGVEAPGGLLGQLFPGDAQLGRHQFRLLPQLRDLEEGRCAGWMGGRDGVSRRGVSN